MTWAPSREMLAELGEDLGWPSVTVGGFTFLGVDAWRASAAVATPPERRAWLQVLGAPLLEATPHARERMQAWRARSAWTAPSTSAWIREHVLYFGDAAMFEPVLAAFQFMPEPVGDYMLREAAFLGVGASTTGWTGSSNLADRDGIGRPRIIVLSGAHRHATGLIDTVLHECAHAWTMKTPRSALPTVQGEAVARAYLAEEGLAAQVDKQVAFDERLARALAAVWATQGDGDRDGERADDDDASIVPHVRAH